MRDRVKVDADVSFAYRENGVNITITDRASNIQFFDGMLSMEQFARALSSLQHRPCFEAEVRGLDYVGKKRMHEEFVMYYDGHLPDKWKSYELAQQVLEDEATKQGYGSDGWIINARPALSQQRGYGTDDKGNWYRLSRVRYVEA